VHNPDPCNTATLSRRSRAFVARQPQVIPRGPLHLVIDSTGLQLFGRGEWNVEKHGRAQRSWRKLHLAIDADSGEIVASTLTGHDVHNAGEVPVLLGQIEGELASVMADGAYDGEPVYRAIHDREPSSASPIIIPLRAGAVVSAGADPVLSQRDHHIRLIQEHGRAAWRRMTGYGKRSLVETAIRR
jgi:hypothetical protein